MKIFILEDRPERLPIIERAAHFNYNINKIVIAQDVKEAIDLFEENFFDFDIIFLDHDLGGETFVDSENENTGYQFAKWLKENDKNIKNRIVFIHSLNPGGADNIHSVLSHAIKVPFTTISRYFNDY